MKEIETNLDYTKKRIVDVCKKKNKDPASITLVCVSKFQPIEKIMVAYQSGQKDFGENRVQEFLDKYKQLPEDIRWHFIGTLQKNKVRKVVGKCYLIQSVDNLELAKKISQVSEELKLKTNILIQVNVSQENSKHGLSIDSWKDCWKELLDLEGICIKGLMTIAAHVENKAIIEQNFQDLAVFLQELNSKYYQNDPLDYLSMGMSSDYEQAICAGASCIRVGSSIFGSRT